MGVNEGNRRERTLMIPIWPVISRIMSSYLVILIYLLPYLRCGSL